MTVACVKSGDVWTFDDFSPGALLGETSIVIDAERVAAWRDIYGEDGGEGGAGDATGRVPRGLLVAGMMEAYLTAVQPRPPGNVHASQKLRFGRPPASRRPAGRAHLLPRQDPQEGAWLGNLPGRAQQRRT